MTLRPYSADLQQQFRATLGTPGAPEIFDDSEPVMAVAVVASTPQAVSVTVNPVLRTGIVASATRSGAGTTAIGTVPALKIWRIVGASVSQSNPGAANATAVINLNGIAVISLQHSQVATAAGGNNEAISFPFDACPVLTAGQVANLVVGVGGDARGSIVYVELDA